MAEQSQAREDGKSGAVKRSKRALIISACLTVVAEYGVAATTHRKIAAEAGVPLGLTTYYFAQLHDVLYEAFSQFAQDSSDAFAESLRVCETPDAAISVIVTFILASQEEGNKASVITHELYTLASREERFRNITQQWMCGNRTALRRFFDADTVRMLDPLIEGLIIHGLLSVNDPDPDLVERAVRRIVGR
ncbi:MAG: TetR family transcriptional regulator [Bifidobacterium crudilactis]|jgi:DNA-binding transcriptional regulator YbjK|nr:TetR family transcriptional regulator [Bifidobacterium crudilactis]